MEQPETVKVHPSESVTVKLVHDGADVKIFEGGWWIKRSDYDALWYDTETGNRRKYPRADLGTSSDHESRQIKIFIIPPDMSTPPAPPQEQERNNY